MVMILTYNDINNFESAEKCHICKNNFEDMDIKVRDHDHITGRYRGTAHQSCNLNLKFPNGVPVIFHKL